MIIKRVFIGVLAIIIATYLYYNLITQCLSSYYLKNARIQIVMKNYPLAEYYCKKAIKYDKTNAAAYFYYGIVMKEQNKLINSYNKFKQAKRYINDLNLEINLAEVCMRINKFNEAKNIYENIIDTYVWDEYMLVAYVNLGRIHFKEGNLNKAKKYFIKAKEFAPDNNKKKIDELINEINNKNPINEF